VDVQKGVKLVSERCRRHVVLLPLRCACAGLLSKQSPYDRVELGGESGRAVSRHRRQAACSRSQSYTMCVHQSQAVRAMLPSAVVVSVSTRVCAVLLWRCIRRAKQLAKRAEELLAATCQPPPVTVCIRPFKPAAAGPCTTRLATRLSRGLDHGGADVRGHDVFVHRRSERRSAPPTTCTLIVLL
jgi:hypothetical protein